MVKKEFSFLLNLITNCTVQWKLQEIKVLTLSLSTFLPPSSSLSFYLRSILSYTYLYLYLYSLSI